MTTQKLSSLKLLKIQKLSPIPSIFTLATIRNGCIIKFYVAKHQNPSTNYGDMVDKAKREVVSDGVNESVTSI